MFSKKIRPLRVEEKVIYGGTAVMTVAMVGVIGALISAHNKQERAEKEMREAFAKEPAVKMMSMTGKGEMSFDVTGDDQPDYIGRVKPGVVIGPEMFGQTRPGSEWDKFVRSRNGYKAVSSR